MNLNYLTICCIAKNEHPYVEEWVAHHLVIGAEKIVIFDNESDPPLYQMLEDYIQKGLVAVHPVQGKGQQMSAYYQGLKRYGPLSKWMAFIDVDEFLIPKKYSDVRFILTDYEDYGALGVHWVEFGSSGHLKRPGKSQIKNYVHRFPRHYPKNMHIKSIVQPERVEYTYTGHSFKYYRPWYCVDENFLPVSGTQSPFTADVIQLNHYYYRSQEDYCLKVERGRVSREDDRGKRKHGAFYRQLQQATIYDDSALKFARKVSMAFEAPELFMERICNQKNERNNLENYADKALGYISQGRTSRAKILIKRLKVCLANRDTVNFVLFKIYKQEGRFYEAIEVLIDSFSRGVDPGLCMEYADLQFQMGNHCRCYTMLLYIRHHFSQNLDSNKQYRSRFEDLWNEVQPCFHV